MRPVQFTVPSVPVTVAVPCHTSPSCRACAWMAVCRSSVAVVALDGMISVPIASALPSIRSTSTARLSASSYAHEPTLWSSVLPIAVMPDAQSVRMPVRIVERLRPVIMAAS